MNNNVYYNLHTYAFDILKQYINHNEYKSFATSFLKSSQVDINSEQAKNSIYHEKITLYISKKYSSIIRKNINELMPQEKIIFEDAKINVKRIIDDEMKKYINIQKANQVQKEEANKAKEKLNNENAEEIKNSNGTYFAKFNDVNGTPIIAEKVGNTTTADMVDKEASFVIDGSGFTQIETPKTSEEIIDKIKKERITNA